MVSGCARVVERSPVRIIALLIFWLAAAPLFAGEVKVAWQPNTEPDLAGYVVYYGPKERPQRYRIEVGRQTQYLISNLKAGETYYIAVTAVDYAGNESGFSQQLAARAGGGSEGSGAALKSFLLQSHPNPFHISSHKNTSFTFELGEEAPVKLEIFNLLGQRLIALINKNLPSGPQKVLWNGLDAQKRPAPAGVYLYRLETNGQVSTRKLVVYR